MTDIWRDFAACKGRPAAIWFPTGHTETSEAKTICAACPVQAACLDYAMSIPKLEGIFGGLTVFERRQRRRSIGTSRDRDNVGVSRDREHGTERGYHQHRYRGEPACDECRRGHSEHVTNQTQRNRYLAHSNPPVDFDHRTERWEQERRHRIRALHELQEAG